MKRWVIFSVLAVFSIIFYSNQIYAFGIATPYFENDTVMLEAGQTFEYTIKIQNNEDISFDVNITYDSDDNVAFLNNTDFFISEKSYENAFTFIITIPNISVSGDIYSLNYAARPIMNISGQVPMNVEIKKSVNFMIVEEGGQGYFAVPLKKSDKLISTLLKILNVSYIYIIAILVVVSIVFVGLKLWRLSSKLTLSKKAPYTINDAKSTQELYALIKLMSNKEFDTEFIRNMYSEKFKELNEPFLSKKVLIVSRKEMLTILK